MVPEGWSDATLGDLVRLQRGHDLPAHSRAEGDVEVIGGGGPNGFHNEAKAPAPGIVIGRSGSGIGNAWWSDRPFWPLNTGMYVTDFLGNDPRFCFLWLDWIDFTSHNSGGAQPSLNRNFIYPIPLPIPPLPEQRKIADILSTWDRAIETTEALLATARTQKRALMQSLLTGKRRFPEFEGQEWKEVRLGDVAIFIKDGTHGTHERFDEGVPMISAVNVLEDHSIDYESAPKISEDEYNKIHKKYSIKKDDILLTVVGTLGRSALVPETRTFTAQRSVAIIRMKDTVTAEFTHQYFQTQVLQNDLRRRANVTAQPGVYLGEISKIAVPFVGSSEMATINRVLSDCDLQIKEHRLDIEKLRAEKRALMQQLLTGKRRVVV